MLIDLLILILAIAILFYIRRTSRALSTKVGQNQARLKKLETSNRELIDNLGRIESSLNLVVIPSLENKDWAFTLSFTTYKARFSTLPVILKCLSAQILQPTKIILALTSDDHDSLTNEERELLYSNNVSVLISSDLGPGKKLIPALKDQSGPVVVIDDDILLPPDLTLQLMTQHHLYPQAIIASRAHQIGRDESGKILKYGDWKKDVSHINGPDSDLFASSGAGTLYPKGAFHPEVMNEKLYCEYCFHTDDLWWHIHSRRQGTLVRRIPGKRTLSFIPGTQEGGLWNTGNKERNETNLQKLIENFGGVF